MKDESMMDSLRTITGRVQAPAFAIFRRPNEPPLQLNLYARPPSKRTANPTSFLPSIILCGGPPLSFPYMITRPRRPLPTMYGRASRPLAKVLPRHLLGQVCQAPGAYADCTSPRADGALGAQLNGGRGGGAIATSLGIEHLIWVCQKSFRK